MYIIYIYAYRLCTYIYVLPIAERGGMICISSRIGIGHYKLAIAPYATKMLPLPLRSSYCNCPSWCAHCPNAEI